MPTWWKRQTATIDAFVAGGVTLCLFWWFGQLLQLTGTVALYAAVFGAFQLLRFVGAQLAELQWVRLHEAVLHEKKQPQLETQTQTQPAAEGYRQAAIIEEAADPENDRLEAEVRQRERRATTSLGVVGGVVWATSALLGLVAASWGVLVVTTLLGGLLASFAFAVRAWRSHEAKRRDYFLQHLERDTAAMLDPKPRVRVDDHLRVGVDFGVPATELEEDETTARSADERAPR